MASERILRDLEGEPRVNRPWEGLAKDLAVVLLCGLLYFCFAVPSLIFFATHRTPAPIWPATGLFVALMILLPKRFWPEILIAVFLAATGANYVAGKTIRVSLGLGLLDATEGPVAVILLFRALGPRITFTRLRELFGLVFLSAILGNGITALGGAAVFQFYAGTPYWHSWRTWSLTHGLGILTLTPFIVSWCRPRPGWLKEFDWPRITEGICLLAVLVGISVAVFGRVSWSLISLPYIVFPVLIWAALRFGVQGASAAAVALAAIAIGCTIHGLGPFAVVAGSTTEQLLHVQSFLAAALVCSLVPATVIAERKQAEEKLRRSEMRLELAQEIAGIGSWVLDSDGQDSMWSEQMFRIMGRERSANEPSYREFLTWVHPEDRDRVRETYTDVFLRQKPFEIDFRYICPDGSWKYLHAIARPERDPRTQKLIAFGTLMDMTDRRRIEDQLRQAQKMEAVGRLAGGVAHDFNNLLGVIIGYTELALTDLKPDDPLRSKIEPISKAAVRAASLTSQLLAFSRRQVLKPVELDLNRVVTDLEKMLKRLIGEEVEIVTDLQSPLAMVKADPGQMDQVILNLAVNSRDAMPNGGKLRISTARFSCRTTPSGYSGKIAPGEYVMLTVSDTGNGMDAATKAHIFEPFFTTKDKGKGTGLGLATVYGIISQSNGHIWADSEVGKGTDMHIVLPAVRPKKQPDAISSAEPATVQQTNGTVLLVEDEAPLRELVQRLVQSMGCTVIEATSGEQAIQIAQERDDIDILLTDVVMPKMDGFELAGKVAAIRHNIKVLFMSGYSDELVMRHLQNGVRSNYIQKPFRPSELRKKLQELKNIPLGDNN